MAKRIKVISWNVNGIRAAIKKGFIEYIRRENPDIICIQETKAQQGQAEVDLPQYIEYWNSAEKKGYSGTAIFSKEKALSITNGIPTNVLLRDKFGDANKEGRVITAEFDKYFIVSVYTPNSKGALERLDLRYKIWDPEFLKYMKRLEKNKPVIFCGDLNVAHTELDLENPDTNHFSHGFTDEERKGFDNLIGHGFVDSYRVFNKEGKNYTWWSPFTNSRAKNIGWRIDYCVVSQSLKDNLRDAFIRPEVMGSDHCPVGIVFEI